MVRNLKPRVLVAESAPMALTTRTASQSAETLSVKAPQDELAHWGTSDRRSLKLRMECARERFRFDLRNREVRFARLLEPARTEVLDLLDIIVALPSSDVNAVRSTSVDLIMELELLALDCAAMPPCRQTLAEVDRMFIERLEKRRIDMEPCVSGEADTTRRSFERLIQVLEAVRSLAASRAGLKEPEEYVKPFTDFLTENPTVFHAVDYFAHKLTGAGYTKLSERSSWTEEVKKGGKYFVERNGSSLIAFAVGNEYKSGNGIAMIAGHVDALTAKLKPISTKKTSAGYVQLGVAPYAGGLNSTWWDRDLGIGGRVLVKDPETGSVKSVLVKLDHPIARIPTLAPHFGVGMLGTNNPETQAVPIIGLDNSDLNGTSSAPLISTLGNNHFAATQPPALLSAIAAAASVDAANIVNWELELFDTQPAQTGGLNKDFIFGGRIDDKLCSWAAVEGFIAAPEPTEAINLVALFDDEEIGSLLRQGARGNFLPSTIERLSEVFSAGRSEKDALGCTYANSFLVSADVTHAVNPNFLPNYLDQHAPRLNVGVVVSADSNGHMTTDAVSTAFITRIADLSGCTLQVFQIRNDSRSGGTVGPMLSSAMGVRAVDVGIPQLSMHSIRATTGAKDPGLGVKLFQGVYKWFDQVSTEYAF